MSTELQARTEFSDIENVLVNGDLKTLSPAQRTAYYHRVCESLGLNPLTRPFDYLILNNKMVLYANRNCAEQLRRNRGISIVDMTQQAQEGIVTTIVRGRDSDGREDVSSASVVVSGLKGESLANAFMKCETKAKRRLTLSLAGLGMLDETEVEAIPNARRIDGPPDPESKLPPPKPQSSPFGLLIGDSAKKAGVSVAEFVGAVFEAVVDEEVMSDLGADEWDWRRKGEHLSASYSDHQELIDKAIIDTIEFLKDQADETTED